jgi:hypothetical protein
VVGVVLVAPFVTLPPAVLRAGFPLGAPVGGGADLSQRERC